MYRVPVFHQPSPTRKSRPFPINIPTVVTGMSGLCAVVSLIGLIWTYIKPASFAAPLTGSGADPTTFGWVPHLPLLAALAILAVLARFTIAVTMHHRRRGRASGLIKGFEIDIWDAPFLIGFLAAGFGFLHPLAAGLVSQWTGSGPSPVQVGCAISRFCFSLLAISHTGHTLFGAWWLWRRRGLN